MTFGERLMKLRRERGLSQEALGDRWTSHAKPSANGGGASRRPSLKSSWSSLGYLKSPSTCSPAWSMTRAQSSPHPSLLPRPDWRWHYEYKSRSSLFGLPLVHINVGRGGFYRATGIIAIGAMAKGVVAIGLVSLGGLAIGAVSVGLLAAGAMALGGCAVGPSRPYWRRRFSGRW